MECMTIITSYRRGWGTNFGGKYFPRVKRAETFFQKTTSRVQENRDFLKKVTVWVGKSKVEISPTPPERVVSFIWEGSQKKRSDSPANKIMTLGNIILSIYYSQREHPHRWTGNFYFCRFTASLRPFFFYSNSRPPARTIRASDLKCSKQEAKKTFEIRFFLQRWA